LSQRGWKVKITTSVSIDYRLRTTQHALNAFAPVGAGWGDLLAPGGSTCSSAGSSCSCTSCGAVSVVE